MTPELAAIAGLIDDIPKNSDEERAYYQLLKTFTQTLDLDLLHELRQRYLAIGDAADSTRAWQVGQLVTNSLPDVIVQQKFIQIVQRS